MQQAPVAAALAAAIVFAAGCGLSYQAASAYRANKMEKELQAGDTMAQVREKFGQPDIEDQPDDQTEIWSYAKHANSGDVTAEIFYTSAKEGDSGTFEDLKFTNGTLVAWSEAQHTMAEKEGSSLTTTLSYGRHGTHSGGSSINAPNPMGVTF